MPFDPKCTRFPYTKETDKHYLVVKKDDGVKFDKDYPFIDKSKKMKRHRRFFSFLLNLVVFPLARIRLNLRIKGRDILKKNKELLKNGAVSVANHIHMWDFICVRRALRGYDPKVLVWDKNINGENGKMIRGVGGIPLPVNDLKAVSQCFKVIREDVSNGGWIHIYAEGSMWEFYQPIRPFKKGASYFAVKCNKPLVPLAFSYRKNGFIRSKIFKSPASLTLSIGEPLLPNLDLPEKERIEDLTRRSHDAVCILAGINPKENIYPEIFNNNERVDYYTTEYGIGYKGSW